MYLVIGGTGRLGSLVVRRLHEARQPVRVLSRGLTPATRALPSGVDVVVGDVRRPETLLPAMDGVEVVVSAVQGFAGPGGVTPAEVDRDGNINVISAAEHGGADLVLVSVLGARADSPMELFRMKYAAEQRLASSTTSWTVVRPDAFAEAWLTILAETADGSGRPLVFGRGDRPVRWVSVDDVAELVSHAALHPALRGRTLEICGPDCASLRELAQLLMDARGVTGEPRRVPRPVLRAAAATVGRVRPDLGRQMRAALALDTLPTNDDAPLRAEFPGLPCTPLAQVVERMVR